MFSYSHYLVLSYRSTVYKYDLPPATEFVVVVVYKANKRRRFCSGSSHERGKHWCLVWRRSRHHMGDECIHPGHFHSAKVMVIFLLPNAWPKHIQNLNLPWTEIATIGFKNILWPRLWPGKMEVVSAKRPLWRAQPPKWRARLRTQPQVAVFVSKVVIAKVTLNTVLLGFSEKLFCLCPLLRGCVHATIQPYCNTIGDTIPVLA